MVVSCFENTILNKTEKEFVFNLCSEKMYLDEVCRKGILNVRKICVKLMDF
jgi:hypothetical protein